jgi:hypothetical protein
MMKAAIIKSSWIALHPTHRMNAEYWLAVVEKLIAAGKDPQAASEADVLLAMQEKPDA